MTAPSARPGRRAPADASTATQLSTRARTTLLVVMCMGYFLVLLDVTIINVALPSIGRDLDADVPSLQWVVNGYALALASLMLGGGTSGDVFGHRRVVLTGLTLFGLGSTACALAPSIGWLITGRVVQGVAAALMLPGTLAVITSAYGDRREQARAIGVWAAIGSIALPAGPVLGGLLVDGPGWRSVFWLNLPFVVVVTAIAVRIVPRPTRTSGRRIDGRGTALVFVALAALAETAIELGRSGIGWLPVTTFVVCVLAFVAFVLVERRVPDPMFPLSLLRRRTFTTANLVAGTMNLCTLGLMFAMTLFLQEVQGYDALEAGVRTIPVALPLVVLSPFVGRITSRIGPRRPMLVGLILLVVGTGLVATWESDTPYVGLVPALTLWGLGLALLTPAVVAAAVGDLDASRAGLGAGVNNACRQAGGLIGVAVAGALVGSPDDVDAFVSGLHVVGLSAAALFATAAAATWRLIPRDA